MDAADAQDGPDTPGSTSSSGAVRLAPPSTRGVVRVVAILAVCGVALWLMWRVRGVIRLGAIALFLALALNPLVDAIGRRLRLPRLLLILMVYVLMLGAVVVIGAVVIPSMVKEVNEISHHANQYARDLRANSTFRHYDNRYHITRKLADDLRRLPQLLGQAAGPLRDVTVQAFSTLGQLVVVLSIAFLLILHGRTYVNLGLRLAGSREERYRNLVRDINRAVAGYVLGNVAISVLSTVATWIVLTILGVPYALSLGVVIGFFDLIPMVGATLGAVVVGLATATVDFPIATIVWVVFIVVWQRFEDYVVQPVVYRRVLQVNPLVTIFAVLVGASLLGLLGALLAIPTAAAIQIILRDWWSSRNPVTGGAGGPGLDPPHRTAAAAAAGAATAGGSGRWPTEPAGRRRRHRGRRRGRRERRPHEHAGCAARIRRGSRPSGTSVSECAARAPTLR